jgi:ribosome-associated protein
LKDLLLATLDDNKAEDIVTVPLEGKSAIADYMIIASGRSARHIVGLAELLGAALSKIGRPARYEGKDGGDWVLMDAGDVIVHLFRPEVRSFYNLEKIWLQPDDTLPAVDGPVRKAVAPRRRKVAASA